MLPEIFRKPFNRGLNGPCRRISERTERLSLNVVAKIQHQLCVFQTTLASINAFENFYKPISTFSAWRAPATRFVFVKLGQVLGRLKNINRFIHDDKTAGTNHGAA